MTHSKNSIDGVLARIAPKDIKAFLVRKGYALIAESVGDVQAFVNDSKEVLLVPLNQGSGSYTRRLRDLLGLFETENASLGDVICEVVLPHSDVFRYRIDTPETIWGYMQLSYTYDAMHALFDLFRFSAAGVATGLRDYRRVAEQAEAYARQCHFGQTEYGSYVLKVYCPTKPINTDMVDDEPFGRASTRAVVENLEFLSSEKAENPSEPLPPALNRQVANAVFRLQPRTRLGINVTVDVLFPSLPSSSDQAVEVAGAEARTELELGPFVYSRAQGVRDRLKRAMSFERELLRGFIVNLHKDRPRADTEQSHEIALEVKYGGGWRILRLRLLPSQYRRALVWQDRDVQIDIDAIIDKRTGIWSVVRLFDFRPTDRSDDAPTLFDVDQ